ncbi:MAG: aldehyde ferredoxin oxidoreductase family protein [bacterium]
MKIKGGYHYRVLYINLSTGKPSVLKFDDDFAIQYIGGRGFGAKFLWDHLKPGLEPLSADNILSIAPGPLTGLFLPSSGKVSFVSLSPATGIYGDSSMGGSFGVEIRQAGYDAICLVGKAKQLSYIWIDDDNVEIVPGPDLKGKNTLATEGQIKEELGDPCVKIATIGLGGENQIRFATINSDWSRNAGRTGMGAVLGSKNIKAIAVRGTRDLPVFDINMLYELSQEAFSRLKAHPYFELWQHQGLMTVIDYLRVHDALPSYNFADGCFNDAEKINGYTMEDHYKIGDTACFACPMACGNICLVKEGKYKGTVCEGPEYETACMLGSNIGVGNLSFIIKANHLCDDYGIDTISTGNLIAAIIEGSQSGLLTNKDLGGPPIQWGDEDRILELIENIAHRTGAGAILADGSKKVLEKWPQLKPILSQTKGLEQSAYEARIASSMALAYGTSDIGAHHTRAWTIAKEMEMGADWGLEEKVNLVIYHQTIRPLFDMLGVCRLPWIELGFPERSYEKFFQATTGLDLTLDDLLIRSKQIYDLTRLINNRLGIGRKDDYPASRVFDSPIRSGKYGGKKVEMKEYDKMLDIYYKKRGWDKNGVPSEEVSTIFQGSLLSQKTEKAKGKN